MLAHTQPGRKQARLWRRWLALVVRQQLQHAEESEPADECSTVDRVASIPSGYAGGLTLRRVEPSERDLDAHVDANSLPTGEPSRHHSGA